MIVNKPTARESASVPNGAISAPEMAYIPEIPRQRYCQGVSFPEYSNSRSTQQDEHGFARGDEFCDDGYFGGEGYGYQHENSRPPPYTPQMATENWVRHGDGGYCVPTL